MLLEVSNVLKEYVRWLMSLQNGNNVVEQSSSSVELTVLESRLREWLTREASTEDIVRRHLVVIRPDVADHVFGGQWKVSEIELAQLIVHLRGEDTLVSKG